MACKQLTALFPDTGSEPDYEKFIRDLAANGGLNCALQNYATNCAQQCVPSANLNTNACFNCLSSVQTCPNSVRPTDACCPIIGQCVQCNNCLNSNVGSDGLSACLNSGLSTGAIVGIVVGVLVVIVLIGIAIYVYWATAKKETLKNQLRQKGITQFSDADLNKLSRSQLQERLNQP